MNLKTVVFSLLLATMGSASASFLAQQQLAEQPSMETIFSLLREFEKTLPHNCDSGDNSMTPFETYLITDEINNSGNALSNPINVENPGPQFENFGANDCFWLVAGGFQERTDCWAPRSLIDEILEHTNCHVIFANWQLAAGEHCFNLPYTPPPEGEIPLVTLFKSLECYVKTVQVIPPAARHLARLLLRIRDGTNLKIHQFRATGVSLGAHLVGYVGRSVVALETDETKKQKLERIIGMDPAGPLFALPLKTVCSELHLRSGDGAHTTSINTNAGVLGTTNVDAVDTALLVDHGVIQTNICKTLCREEDPISFLSLECQVCSHGASVKTLMYIFADNTIPVCKFDDLFCLLWGKSNFNIEFEKHGIFKNYEEFDAPAFDSNYAPC